MELRVVPDPQGAAPPNFQAAYSLPPEKCGQIHELGCEKRERLGNTLLETRQNVGKSNMSSGQNYACLANMGPSGGLDFCDKC